MSDTGLTGMAAAEAEIRDLRAELARLRLSLDKAMAALRELHAMADETMGEGWIIRYTARTLAELEAGGRTNDDG